MRSSLCATLLSSALCLAGTAAAQSPAHILKRYEAAARAAPGFSEFSPRRGASFFAATHGTPWSCASCHDDPTAPGRHAKTGKAIAPLAPAANPERFSTFDKTEKWFRRNCNDVLNRECTALEKGDVLAYLMSLGR